MYRAVDTECSESLFLEDLSVRNFAIVDRHTEDINADHVRLMMKCMGKYHALSLALQSQQPEVFNELTSNLVELYFRPHDRVSRDFYNSITETIFEVVSGEEDASLMSKMKEVFSKETVDVAADCINPASAAPASVIRHGDSWQSNVMFRNDEHGKPTEISLLDWQISHHATPIADIVHFIFSCTTKELRDAHYDEFLNIYHSTLSDHIRKYGHFTFTTNCRHCCSFVVHFIRKIIFPGWAQIRIKSSLMI